MAERLTRQSITDRGPANGADLLSKQKKRGAARECRNKRTDGRNGPNWELKRSKYAAGTCVGELSLNVVWVFNREFLATFFLPGMSRPKGGKKPALERLWADPCKSHTGAQQFGNSPNTSIEKSRWNGH
jgi:hypothetical protein